MKALRYQVDETTACQKFTTPRWPRLQRLLGIPSRSTAAHLELVHLPHYLVKLSFQQGSAQHSATLLVGGLEPTVALIDPVSLTWSEQLPAETFPPRLDAAQATELAHRETLRLLLTKPALRSAPISHAAPTAELVQYPFWAYYFRRRGGMLDVRLLDAVTGSTAGPKAKIALLAALAAARRS